MTEYGNPKAGTVLIQMVDDHDPNGLKSEVDEIRRLTDTDFYLIALRVKSWNNDLSPWKAPPVFGKEGFGGGAADTLSGVLKYTEDRSRAWYIGGYSLAGLFALWSAYRTDVFKGVAAASPSIWFPGFTDYMRNNTIHAGSIYLSLGDKEAKAGNPLLASVEDRIREAHDLLKEEGIDTILEFNPGNHFKDADIRTARAFAWVMERSGGRLP